MFRHVDVFFCLVDACAAVVDRCKVEVVYLLRVHVMFDGDGLMVLDVWDIVSFFFWLVEIYLAGSAAYNATRDDGRGGFSRNSWGISFWLFVIRVWRRVGEVAGLFYFL